MKLRQITFVLLATLGLLANAANKKTTVTQVTDGVKLTEDVDYIITSETPFSTTGSVDIVNTDHAVLIISSIKPSKVLSGNLLKSIYINGIQAQDGVNCQVKMYNRGTIIFPYASDIQPLTCYTEQNFEGEACSNYSEGHSGGYMKTLTTALLNNKIRSFKLKRGYMVTFAIGQGGWGYSRCFIADQEDLEVTTLSNILDKRISSYRIFKWHNAHKAGLASDGNHAANQALNTSWCYDWGQGNANNMPDTEWVPNHIYEDWPSSSTCGSVTASCHMKTNNEPGNSSDDHPQDVATVLGNWQNLMRTGMRLCSESSHDGSMNHLKSFIDSIDARGWRCDLVDLHCYWASGTFNNLNWYSDTYGNGRPIWISEWIWGASWNRNGAFADGVTDDQILSETKKLLNLLNSNERVERYAYWNSESKGHIYENSALTELGKYYATMNDGMGYRASLQKIPNPTRAEELSDLSYTYDRKKGTVALTWSDPNGDLMEKIAIQRKSTSESRYLNLHTIATVTPRDKTSAAGATYTYTDTITEPGAYNYRIVATTYDNKDKVTKNTITVDIAPAMGTKDIQYGKLSIGTTDKNTIYYSESFEETPCVFMGTISNKNSKLLAGNVTAQSSSKSSFTYQLFPWQTNTEALTSPEEIPFLALRVGNYQYGNLTCEVGTIDAKKATQHNWTDTTEVVFNQPFPEGVLPVVLTEVRNPGYISASPYTTLSPRIFDVTNTGFKLILYSEDESNRKINLSKTVCYLAITPGLGTVDEENDIIIAAGHSSEQLYGTTARAVNFLIDTNDEQNEETASETLKLYQPAVFTALQTNNYPAVTMLRRGTDLSSTDENGTKWLTGIRVKRVLDHTLTVDGKTIATSTTDAGYRDNAAWVAVARYKEGGSKPATPPTAIQGVPSGTAQKPVPHVVGRRIYVNGATSFDVYNTAGMQVASDAVQTPGIYVVKVQGQSTKVLVK